MTSTSSTQRLLQVFALVLGIANIVLLVMWTQADPPAPPRDVEAAATVARTPTVQPEAAAVEASTAAPDSATPAPSEPAPTKDPVPSSAMLFGTMSMASGDVVSNGHCWLYRDGVSVGSYSLRAGTYVFVGLQLGEYRLRTRIDDQLPMDRIVLVDRAQTRLDITLDERWLLSVNAVTPDGEPLLPAVLKEMGGFQLRGLTAVAFEQPLTKDLPPSNLAKVSAGVGTFRSQSFPPRGKALPKQTVGMLALPPGRPLHVTLLMRNVMVAQQQVTPGQEEVEFVLGPSEFLAKTATVSLRVVDESGKPIADANVALNDAQTGGGGRKTDEAGRITLTNLLPGSLDLEVRVPKRTAPPVQINVPASAKLDLGDVMVRPGVPLEFDLSNFGQGKGSVRFNLLDPPGGWTADSSYMSTQDGSSRTYHVYPGRYGFVASGPNGVAVLEVNAHIAPGEPIRFDLRSGTPLRIDYKLGSGWARVELSTPAGVIVRRREVTGSSQESVRLPPGIYVALITDESGKETRREITLGAQGAVLTVP